MSDLNWHFLPLKKEVKSTRYKIRDFEMNSSVGFTTFTMLHNHYLYRVPKLLVTPEENPIPTKKSFPTPYPARPGNQQSAFCPYVWIYLFWKFHKNGTVQYGTFCVWLFFFTSHMFSKAIYVVICMDALFLLWINNIPWHVYTTFCLFIHQLKHSSIVSTFIYQDLFDYIFFNSFKYIPRSRISW